MKPKIKRKLAKIYTVVSCLTSILYKTQTLSLFQTLGWEIANLTGRRDLENEITKSK